MGNGEKVLLSVKTDKDDLDSFKTKCESFGKPYSSMIREMITAFNEGRVKIIPTEKQKENLEIYQD